MVAPYQVSQVLQHWDKDLTDKPRYNMRNLVTNKEYVVDVTHIWPFHYDPAYATPLNITVKDTDETVVVKWSQEKKWLVRWLTDPLSETWEQYENQQMLRNSNITVPLTGLTPFLRNSPLSSPHRFLSCPGGQFTFPPVKPTAVRMTRPPTDANVPACQRGRQKKGTIKMHKAFPQSEGLNGMNVGVLDTFSSTSEGDDCRTRWTLNTLFTRHHKEGGGNVVIRL